MSALRSFNVLLIAFVLCSFTANADVDELIMKGTVHLNGRLVEGGCAPSPSFKEVFVDMGEYNSKMFLYPGQYSTESIPFSIKLLDCSQYLRDTIKIFFYGKTDEQDSQGFEATVLNGDKPVSSGLVLSIFDADNNIILPNTAYALNKLNLNQSEGKYTFIAKYKSGNEKTYPGYLNTDVWFVIKYP